MSRVLILAVGAAWLLIRLGGEAVASGPKIEIYINPLITNTVDELFGNGSRHNGQRARQSRQHVISHSDRFHGSYYVEKGSHYYQPHGARRVVIERGSFSYVDDLAERFDDEVNQLGLDMHDNYDHNRGYHKAYRGVYQLLESAEKIRVSLEQEDRAAVGELVRGLDSLFQPVRRDVEGWTRRQHRQRGRGGLPAKIERVESLIHHLLHDVGPAAPTAQMARAEAPANAAKKAK